MFEDMWDAFHQAREEEQEEVPEQESTVILHTFKFSSVTDLVTLVTGYIEVLDPYYCHILSFLQRKFERRGMPRTRRGRRTTENSTRTIRRRHDRSIVRRGFLEDGTCRQLLYWNINEELLGTFCTISVRSYTVMDPSTSHAAI